MVQAVEGPAQAVILQQADVIGLQAEVFRNAPSQPFTGSPELICH
jgi:hypothetical protein